MPKLVIATPLDGDPASALCAYAHAKAVGQLLAECQDAAIVSPWLLGYPSDLVRARSRVVRMAIDWDATHVLWLDSDVVPKAGSLGTMLASGFDWIGCPYPRKRVHWERVGGVDDSEANAYSYAYHRTTGPEGPVVQCVNGCIAVERLSIGCTLTSVRALRAMWAHFADEDRFTDVVDGEHFDCVALFGLLFSATYQVRGKPFRALFSEDYSACERYNVVREAHPELGFAPIQLLATHVADHVGSHLFRGDARGLIYAR
jgi:hypothetical protein